VITAIRDGHVHETPARELTQSELIDVRLELVPLGVHVTPAVDVYHYLHLWSLVPTSTRQEVAALRAFAARTDARLVWHGAAS
jgi:hypothetical protein